MGMLCSGVDFNHLSCTIGLVTAYFKGEITWKNLLIFEYEYCYYMMMLQVIMTNLCKKILGKIKTTFIKIMGGFHVHLGGGWWGVAI